MFSSSLNLCNASFFTRLVQLTLSQRNVYIFQKRRLLICITLWSCTLKLSSIPSPSLLCAGTETSNTFMGSNTQVLRWQRCALIKNRWILYCSLPVTEQFRSKTLRRGKVFSEQLFPKSKGITHSIWYFLSSSSPFVLSCDQYKI